MLQYTCNYMNNNLYLSEVYSAIQGEGPLVGHRQIFIRLSACDLRCVWCDTPESLTRVSYCRVEKKAGLRKFHKIKNPLLPSDITSYINNLLPEIHHSVSITGGEPLLQSASLKSLILELKTKFSLPVYLETGGHRPDKLKDILKNLDYISMDFKLPSSSQTIPLWDRHREFLALSLRSKNIKDIWIKIVLTADTKFSDLLKSVKLVHSLCRNKKVDIILQPVTQINGVNPPKPSVLLDFHSKLLTHYPYIRVIPQLHKIIGQT